MVKIAFFDENKEDTNFLSNLTHLNTIKLEKKKFYRSLTFLGIDGGPLKVVKGGI